MFTESSKTIRISLMAVLAATLTTLNACDDISHSTPKPAPSVTQEPPKPEPLPAPTAVTVPTPKTDVAPAPEVVKPVAVDDEEDAKPADVLGAAREMLDKGDADKAFKLAKVAVGKMPKRSSAWNTLGRAQLQLGKRKDAITSFGKAVELNPKNSFAQNNLGLALIYDKRYDEAIDALEQAVQLEPVEGYMWNNLGMAYEQLDRLDEARDAYDQAVAMDSDRARDSLTRLKGVSSVVRTAKVDTDAKSVGDGSGVKKDDLGPGPTQPKDQPTEQK
jgi:tetratricopeptide (TPR) repeat protein